MNELVTITLVACVYMGVGIGWRLWQRARLKKLWLEGQKALGRGDMRGAAEVFRKCAAMNPAWPAVHRLLGMTLAASGEIAGAEAEVKLAADLQPNDPEGQQTLCLLYAVFMPERDQEALEALARLRGLDENAASVLARDPRLARLRNNPGFAAAAGLAEKSAGV